MTENNAAQAATSAIEWASKPGAVENFPATARAHINGLASLLLSKLRAEGVQAGDEVEWAGYRPLLRDAIAAKDAMHEAGIRYATFGVMFPEMMRRYAAALASAPASEDGLTAKQAWWAGYRAGKGLPPDTPRQDAVKVDVSSARLVTHWPNGTPRDERDTASDPEGKLIHDPTEPLLAAIAPVAGEAYQGDSVAERLDNMADRQPSGSQAQSDLYAAATIWRKHIAHRAAPQASALAAEYARGRADGFDAAKAAPQASEAVPVGIINAARYAGFTFLRHADGSYTLQPIVMATAQADKDGGDCTKGAGDVPASFDQKARDVAHSVTFYGDIQNRVSQAAQLQCAVAEAMQWAVRQQRAALPTPSVVKQSLTATQTGEKGESDE